MLSLDRCVHKRPLGMDCIFYFMEGGISRCVLPSADVPHAPSADIEFHLEKSWLPKKNPIPAALSNKRWNVTCCLQRVARRSADSSIVGYLLWSEKNVVWWNRFGWVVAEAPHSHCLLISAKTRRLRGYFSFFGMIVFPAFFCCQSTKIQQSVYILRRFCYCLKLVVHICYVVNWNGAQEKFMCALWVM